MYNNAVDQKKDEEKVKAKDEVFKIATVTSLTPLGCAKITFAGEEQESTKEYSYLYSYTPSVGDVVVCMRLNNTYAIIGKLVYQVAPYVEEQYTDDDIKTLAEEKIAEHKFLPLRSNGTINITTRNNNFLDSIDSNWIRTESFGCNGKNPRGAYLISTLNSNADLSDVRSKVNSIINGLISFGLFS